MLPENKENTEEGITIFGGQPSEVLDAFYKLGLAAKGFSIVGRIVPQSACIANGNDENANLFNGEKLYAGTFIRQAATPQF